jgi:hypothetical protein
MKAKDQQLMIIEALATCIARKNQKLNRKKRILKDSEEKGETRLHQFRRNVYRSMEDIKKFQELKQKLESEFEEKQ